MSIGFPNMVYGMIKIRFFRATSLYKLFVVYKVVICTIKTNPVYITGTLLVRIYVWEMYFYYRVGMIREFDTVNETIR